MRLFHPSAFDFTTTVPSYWEASAEPLDRSTQPLQDARSADVAVIGGGYAGLHAALHLTKVHGLKVCVLEAGDIGWGASGRNGGFCCPGSTKLSFPQLISRFGLEETRSFHTAQREAVNFVGEFLDSNNIEADCTGDGELQLAHTPARVEDLKLEQAFARKTFGVDSTFYTQAELAERGNDGAGLYGGLQSDITFGLHPLKYVRGLARAAIDAGVRVFTNAEVTDWVSDNGLHTLKSGDGQVTAKTVLVATNGYTDETLPTVLGGRLLPALTRIIVTRPISDNELKLQGWLRTDPSYDTRSLLHYFRLLPDNRFLFGGRGGTDASLEGMKPFVKTLRADFDAMFPRLAHVETEYSWGGLVCLTSTRTPFAGPIDGLDDVWGSFGWHGNGVAMASYAANRLADVIAGCTRHDAALPGVLRTLPGRFVLPSLRVQYLKAAYMGYGAADRWR